MEFTIDNVFFKGNIDLSDEICVKSLHKIYGVYYSNKSLTTIVNEIYNSNDFIFIDRNVYNIDINIFENKNVVVFDALETNKNIESVLKLTDKLYSSRFTKKIN